MPEKVECQICYLRTCISIFGKDGQQQPWRQEHFPWMPWVKSKFESVADCPIRRDPENHQDEINMYKPCEPRLPY